MSLLYRDCVMFILHMGSLNFILYSDYLVFISFVVSYIIFTVGNREGEK
jgi:hypothetical protein